MPNIDLCLAACVSLPVHYALPIQTALSNLIFVSVACQLHTHCEHVSVQTCTLTYLTTEFLPHACL